MRKRKENAIKNINKGHEDESEVDESDDEQDIQASLLSKRPLVTDVQTSYRVTGQDLQDALQDKPSVSYFRIFEFQFLFTFCMKFETRKCENEN